MNNLTVKDQKALYYRAISLIVALVFFFTSVVPFSYGQSPAALNLPIPGMMITQSPAFVPVLLKGMEIYPNDPFRFDFFVNNGDTNFLPDQIKEESLQIIKYFLAAMTIPQDDLWVNLSPYEANKTIPNELGRTELGRDMLAQDYILKQLTASLLYPEKDLGKAFWEKVYKKVQEKFGTTDVPVNTFNKIWIVPDEALVYENGNAVYIVKSRLKVMMEEDFQAIQQNRESQKLGRDKLADSHIKNSAALSCQIVREVILPEIEREVNEGKNFASIRQIYQALILAKWYKETIKGSLLSKVYIDQKKITGVDLSDPTVKDQIYSKYLEAFKKGVFNFIKEDYDRQNQEVVLRKYFSGGEKFGDITLKRTKDAAQINASSIGDNYKLAVRVDPQIKTGGADSQINNLNRINASMEPLSLRETNADKLEFDAAGLDIAFKIFDSQADVPKLLKELSGTPGVERVVWRDGVLTIISKTEVVKIHPKELEINERHQIKDRFYVKSPFSSGEMAVKIYYRDSRDEIKQHNKPVYVLGIVRPSHDAGAALIKNGVLVGAIEEERLNLDKHANAYFPKEATRYLLEANGITWEDLDHIAVTYDYNFYQETPGSKAPHYYYRQKYNLPFKDSYRRYDIDKFQSFLEDMAVAYGTGYIPPVTFVKHHKAHAAAAYYASGYTEPTLVVSIDGQGEDESTTIWLAKEGKLEKIASTTPFTNSLGHFYHIITVYLGYRRHDEGKVMGYAPYGAPRNAAEEKIVAQLRGMMQELIRFNRKTEQIEMNPEDFESTTMAVFPGIKFSEKFLQRLSKIVPPMPEGKTGRDLQPEDRNRAHLAFAMQERVEQVITDMIAYYLNVNDKTKGVRYVVMTGGLALNIASNGRLIENGTVEADKFFVPAYPADDGTSVGAALSVADEEYGLDVQSKVTKISLGKTYSDKEIKNTLDFFGLAEGSDYQYIESDEKLIKEVADAIINDKTVAWFQGGAELGPRALGNRSILNKLTDPYGNLKVNRIKNRESWRPSALSIQEERAAEFLKGISSSSFMTIAFPVAEEKKNIIKAGAHPGDGTTRPQTVSREANPLYWALLKEMGKRTGVPGVLNTSFNRRGPIVETPEDALNTYYYGEGLDFLVIGHFLLKRKDNIIPSVLNGRDENKLKNLFDAGMASDKALTGPWDAFWTEANRLAASKAATHQHYLIVNVDDGGNSREVLRVPLVKEMFQEGPREVMIANLSEKIQKEIGRNGPVTISIETTAPQFRDIVVDFFQRFAPEDIKKNWNIVTFGFGERSPPKDSPQQKRVRFVEASEALNKNIQKWQEEKRATPILVAVTGPDEKGRDSLLDRLQGKHFVIDAGAWNLDASQVNTSLYYPFSNVRFNDYVNALKRLKSGQTAMIPLPQVLSEGLPQRGFVLLNAEIKEKYRSFLVKEGSSVWVRHDGQLFEEIKPEAGDVFVVNTPVALNYPVLRGLFEESYFVAIDKELETPLRTGNDAAILNSTREVKFASTIIEPEKDNRGDNPQTSWVPLNTPLPIKQFDSMCIALTNYCPVGCAFCFMRSVQNKRNKISLDSKAIERILYYAKKNQVYRLMLSGGEPLSEMETVLRIIREAEVPNITIFTSAFFASDASHAQEVLGQLAAAVEERKQSGKKPIHILLDVSVDEFHARRVPQRNIINIIKEFDGNWNSKFADFTLQVKGILSEKDPIPGLIKTLGGKIQGDAQSGPFPIKPVILPSGYAFTVRYSEIKLLKDMLGTELARKQFDKVYQKRLEEDAIYVGRGERDGANFSINYDGVVSVNDYLAKNFVLGNANNDNFANDIDRRLRFDPLVVALREIGLNTVLDIASRLRPNIRGRSIETNNQFIAVSDILEDEELREYVYKELIQLIEKRENPAEKISVSNSPLLDAGVADLSKKVFIIGNGRIELDGSVTVKGNRSQIRFQGENQENLVIHMGKGLVLEDCFISLRNSQGQARVDWQGDTLVVEKMSIGDNVKITKGGEVMNVPRIGKEVKIESSFLIEMDEDGVGDRAKILGNSEARMSTIGSDVVVDQQSKIFKSTVSPGARIINTSLIGGQDELVGGWRQKDEGGGARGVVIGKGVEFRNGLAHHFGANAGKINPITVADGVKLDGVYLISEHNEGINVAVNLELDPGQRVYIYDGVNVDERIKNQIQKELVAANIVRVHSLQGVVSVRSFSESSPTADLLNVLQLKKEYAAKKTREIPKIYSIDTIEEAQALNEILQNSDVFINRSGQIATSRNNERADIAVRIGRGAFVYPGVAIYANEGRKVNINVWDLGNRGGALIIADKKDVQLGPKDRLAGRIVAAVIRDVNVDGEFNDFGGIADTIVGNAKITIRNQGILRNANLSSDREGRGEIIWGSYQGKNVDIEIHGDGDVGLSQGGIIEGQSLREGVNSIRLVSGFNSGYKTVIRDERQEPIEPIVYGNSYNQTDFSTKNSSSLYGGIDLKEIEVKRRGGAANIQFNPDNIQVIIDRGINGLVPVLIDLKPINNSMSLLRSLGDKDRRS